MSSEKTMHEVFTEAAGLVQRGWCQSTWQSKNGKKVCTLQSVMSVQGIDGQKNPWGLPVSQLRAIDEVLADRPDYQRIRYEVISQAIHPLSHASIMRQSIIRWNDATDRRQHQVIEVLRAAAKAAEAKWWDRHNHRLSANRPLNPGISISPISASRPLVAA